MTRLKSNIFINFILFLVVISVYFSPFFIDRDIYRNMLGYLNIIFYFLMIISAVFSVKNIRAVINNRSKNLFKVYFFVSLLPLLFIGCFIFKIFYQMINNVE